MAMSRPARLGQELLLSRIEAWQASEIRCKHLVASSRILNRRNDPLLEIAMKLEAAALEDQYFITRNLYPNVDFYSGIVLHAMGIPVSMYTVLFAVRHCGLPVTAWRHGNMSMARPLLPMQ